MPIRPALRPALRTALRPAMRPASAADHPQVPSAQRIAPGYPWHSPPGGFVGLAATFASVAHLGQVRKVTGLPYIVHPFRVAMLCGGAGCSDEQIAAAWCHDVLEDCPDHRDGFLALDVPMRVKSLVGQLTKPLDPATGKGVKGDGFLAHLRAMSDDARAIKMADRIDNLRDGHVMPREWMVNYLVEASEILAICANSNATLAEILAFTINRHQGRPCPVKRSLPPSTPSYALPCASS